MKHALVMLMTASVVAAACIFIGFASTRRAGAAKPASAVDTRAGGGELVLVELFTSEGCSSCPPADQLLDRLVRTQQRTGTQIVPLEEHVDYWNRLGWADPYSSRSYTERQQAYARSLRLNDVYTPQAVVDGRREMLGSDEDALRSAIADSAKDRKPAASVTFARSEDGKGALTVHVDPINRTTAGEAADVIAAITEDNLSSNVARGENAGRKLQHTGVVRFSQIIGHPRSGMAYAQSTTIALQPGWTAANLHAVIFVQGHDSGAVYAVATAPLRPAADKAR